MKSKIVSATVIFSLMFLCGYPQESASARTGTVLSADSVSISYTVDGEDSPAIVFVHGWCCDRGYWKNQVPVFANKYTVVTVDLAGHGESGMNRSYWTLKAFASDVSAVVRSLGLERVILVGHSMGGPVALEAAPLLPGRVLGVVGVDTYQNFAMAFSKEQQEQFLGPFETDFAGMTKRFARSMFTPDADSALVAWIVGDMAAAPPGVAIAVMRDMLAFDPKEIVGEIGIPIYAINSDLFPTNVEANTEIARTFRAKFVPGVGHFVMLEDPERFNLLLEEVISELTAE